MLDMNYVISGFLFDFSYVSWYELVVCTREHIPENADKAIRWWRSPCSNLWLLKSEAKLFSEDVEDWWRVVRLFWGFKLLSLETFNSLGNNYCYKWNLRVLKLPWWCQQRKSDFFIQSLIDIISEKKKCNILSLCIYSRKDYFILLKRLLLVCYWSP